MQVPYSYYGLPRMMSAVPVGISTLNPNTECYPVVFGQNSCSILFTRYFEGDGRELLYAYSIDYTYEHQFYDTYLLYEITTDEYGTRINPIEDIAHIVYQDKWFGSYQQKYTYSYLPLSTVRPDKQILTPGSVIPVQWSRPIDMKILEDSFTISVENIIPGGGGED